MNSREHGKVGAVTSTGRIGYPRTLWLVRHAESAGNVANAAALAEGLPELDLAHRDMDVPLSDRGVLPARALSIWLEGLPELPDVIWSSPYRRALDRSEERRVGKACVRTGRSRWSPNH